MNTSLPPWTEGVSSDDTPTIIRERSITVPDSASVRAKELALYLERELSTGQLRIDDPDRFAAFTGGAGVWSWLDWLGRMEDECPAWGSKQRDTYLDDLWRDEPLLSGVMFTMMSRIAVTGWTISGPVDLLRGLWALFGEAEVNRSWSYLVRPVAQNYLATDIGGIVQHPRDEDGMVDHLYYLPSRRCLAGPIRWKDDVWDLLYQDVDGSWKGLQNPQFTRICSMPDSDPLMRTIGFCFLSRCQLVGRQLKKLREYKEEKLANLPPEGIASVTGLTKTQVETAIALYNEERRRNESLTFPGVLWLVANTFGQQASVDFISFRDVWVGFDDRTEHEIAMKTISLDAGVDVGEFWQVEFHGATRAAAERQHRKALGKGPAEFMVDFERAATSWLPFGCVWRFDVIDDAQDLVVEQVRAARLKNILDLWRPDPVLMAGLLTTEQAQELLAQWRVVPQRFFMPKESIVTDIIRELTGRDVGTIDQDGVIYRHRQYWQLNKEGPGRGWWAPPKGTHGKAVGGIKLSNARWHSWEEVEESGGRLWTAGEGKLPSTEERKQIEDALDILRDAGGIMPTEIIHFTSEEKADVPFGRNMGNGKVGIFSPFYTSAAEEFNQTLGGRAGILSHEIGHTLVDLFTDNEKAEWQRVWQDARQGKGDYLKRFPSYESQRGWVEDAADSYRVLLGLGKEKGYLGPVRERILRSAVGKYGE